jgi:hypothetical protein
MERSSDGSCDRYDEQAHRQRQPDRTQYINRQTTKEPEE